MYLCTLAEVRPDVRSQAGVQRVRYVEDSDINLWIVQAWARLYHDYVMSGHPYVERAADLEVLSGLATQVPKNLYRLTRVGYLSGDTEEELPDLDSHEVIAADASPTGGRAYGYRHRGNELELPGAAAGQRYRVTYAPRPEMPRAADGSFIDTQQMEMFDVTGREWVTLQAAIRAVQKQREDADSLIADAALLRREINTKANRPRLTGLKRVAEVVSFDDPFLSPASRWSR
jgi:hypothetical protein